MICKDKEIFMKPLTSTWFCCIFVTKIIYVPIIKIKYYNEYIKIEKKKKCGSIKLCYPKNIARYCYIPEKLYFCSDQKTKQQ